MSGKGAQEDDFDDVLDEFHAPPAASGPSAAPSAAQSDPVDLESDDFLTEFTKNMRAILSEQQGPASDAQREAPAAPSGASAQNTPEAPLSKDEEDKIRQLFTEALEKDFALGGDPGQDADRGAGAGISEQDLQDAFKMVDERFKGPEAGTSSQPAATSASGSGTSTSFQDTLRATAERLKTSEQSARQANASGGNTGSQPDLAQLLASLGGGAGGGAGGPGLPGEDDEEGLQNALEMMMGQLMSKELLYEPMADLKARYPDYLKEHGATLPPDERERYEKQNNLVNQIVAVFDRPNYSDQDPTQKEEVVSLMTRMQECGIPPKGMMGDLPPGLDFGGGNMPDLDSCPTS